MTLTMDEYLRVVAEYGTESKDVLLARGVHPNVLYAKAQKASRKGYTDYGVVADRPWLTDKGRAFLADDE